MKSFNENRPFIENEFENAHLDPSTGLSPAELEAELSRIQEAPTDEPRPIFCAKAYAYLLDHVQLEINEHTPFSVKLGTGVDYTNFATTSLFDRALFSKQNAKVLREKLPKEHDRIVEGVQHGLASWVQVDFTHTVPNWEFLLEQGFSGILQYAQNSKESLLNSGNYKDEQITFLNSVIICYEAILRLLHRIYDYSLSFPVPAFSECIKNLISAPPKTLYEAMQFSVLYLYFEEITRERGRTLGNIDTLYLPHYLRDKENGMSEEEAKELFRYFYMHFTAAKRFAQQPLTICGSDKDGNDLTNELTFLMLDTYDELKIYDPKIHVRYHKNLDERILTKVLSMIRAGNNSFCLISDEVVYKGYERIGIPMEDACKYVILGCYEPIIMGLEEAEIAASRINLVKFIELALNSGKDMTDGTQLGLPTKADITSFEEFYDIFIQQLEHWSDFAIDACEKQGFYSTLLNPAPIYSSSFPVCLDRGMDVHEYPLKYNNMSIKYDGLATAVDSLMALKKFVFETKQISLAELRNALINNWEGYEDLRQSILNDPEKYGNNLDAPDELTVRITKHIADKYNNMPLKRGGVLRLGLDSVYHCINQGLKTAATPDGRLATTPLSKNMCASDGMDREGITAFMQSFLKIDSTDYVNSSILDFIMHPSAVQGEKGLEDFKSLIKIFLDNGGMAIQGNILNSETLKEAQKNPQKYATLQVRVCGWNEYFVKLSKVKQDMFIKQCEVLRV